MLPPHGVPQPAHGATGPLAAELEASLLRELQRTWRELNGSLFGQAMRAPVLRVQAKSALLGRWDRGHRAIELSWALVLEHGWGEVVEVLKHEMAHQYAHEVLGAADEVAHGPAFRHVCVRLGIDPAASGAVGRDAAVDPDRARVLKRVAGLLALADSPNRHEAETAAALAQRLMLKHNIELTREPGRARYGFRHLGQPKGRVSESEHILAAILAEHFFVEAIWVPAYRPHDGTRGSLLEISGTPENLEIAGYVHAFLTSTAARLWTEHRRTQAIGSNRHRRGYLAGVMEGFRERLAMEQRRSAERGMVWIGDADLKSFYRKRHPHVRSVRLSGHGHSQARASGREAGKQIVLHRGVTEGHRAAGPAALPPARR